MAVVFMKQHSAVPVASTKTPVEKFSKLQQEYPTNL
jgi:hypothetical protein